VGNILFLYKIKVAPGLILRDVICKADNANIILKALICTVYEPRIQSAYGNT